MAEDTAYAEALKNISSGKGSVSGIPSYMVASDTLNVANGNKTFLESAADTINSVPKFIGLSIISGANQLYNILPSVGNLLGGDFEVSDTEELISSLDTDLGAFYKEHQGGIDLVGFLASSLVPGTAAVKVLNAGQKNLRSAIGAGKFGANTGKALGLLVPRNKALMRKALKEVRDNSGTASLLNGTALKAVGSGLQQGVLEATAFEIGVAATMFNSPILENMEFGDYVNNIAFSAGIFGLVGGTVSAVKLKSALNRAEDSASIAARPYTFIEEAAEVSTPYEKLALDYEQLANIPSTIPANVTANRADHLRRAAEAKKTFLDQRIRTNIRTIAGEDQVMADALHETFKRANLVDQHSAFIGMVEASSMSTTSKAMRGIEKLENKLAAGVKLTDKEATELAENSLVRSFAKLHGEGAGIVTPASAGKPVITYLSDTLKVGEKIVVKPTGVIAGKKKYSFDLKYNTKFQDQKAIKTKPWNIKTASALEANARYAWAQSLKPFVSAEITAKNQLRINVNDIPLMEKVFTDLGDEALTNPNILFSGKKRGEASIASIGWKEFLGRKKVELAISRLEIAGEKAKRVAEGERGRALVQEEIAAIVNVKSSMLDGEMLKPVTGEYHLKDIMAMQDNAETYTRNLIAQGSRKESDGLVKIWEVPQHAKLTYDTSRFEGVNNFVVENMTVIKEQQKLYADGLNRASANALGEFHEQLIDIPTEMIKTGAVPSGAGATLLGAASNNYGSLASFTEFIGSVTSRAINTFKESTTATLEPLLYKLGQNQQAAIEWSTLNARVRSIEGQYGLNPAGNALEPLVLLRWRQATEEAVAKGTKPPERPVLANPSMPMRIDLATKEVRDLAKTHIELNTGRTNKLAALRTAGGMQFNRSPDVFYPIPVNPAEYPHWAMVIDESITSGNQTKTLFATNAEELGVMINKIKDSNPQLAVRTKNEIDRELRARGEWNYEKTLSDNYLDVAAHRAGASAPFIVPTEPKKIVSDMLGWHLQRDTGLVREAVASKYEVQIEELKRLGEEFTNVAASKFDASNLKAFAEDKVANPFNDYIKTMLAVKKTADYPFWVNVNQLADKAFSKFIRGAERAVQTAKTPQELANVNKMLERAGYKGAHYDSEMEIFANSTPAQGALSTVVQRANSLMATVVLRWDFMNSGVNAISSNVLLGAETKAVMRALQAGGDEAKNALGSLSNITVPGGKGQQIFSAHKLIASSMGRVQKYIMDPNSAEYKFAKDNGYLTRISDQYKGAIDDLTFNPSEGVATWDQKVNKLHGKLKSLGDKGEKWTGNRLAEEWNRLVAVDVMKQMTDIGVKQGVITNKEQLAYINTFVNRTQGNYLAAQRPMMFQGPVGQAVGLFQTYQFNLMQQLLRHVGEGHAKDAMTLMALQGTIHGMNGLPAFNAVNTHIIGTASGNQEHRDIYDATYGALGKEGGDWLMYGLGSNALGLLHPDLKVNMYTRGDINPRHLTILPTNPSSVPIVQASYKVMANIFDTAGKIQAGGDVSTTLLQGLEHNGLSRPLAGLAQTLEGLNNPMRASYSTSKRGNVISSNDLLSLANLGRIAGAKPLDEAIALDATYRYKAYGLKDSRKRYVLGEAIKSTLIAGNKPTRDQIEEFALNYAAAGGRQEEFAGWFTQLYKTANLSQATEIQNSLRSPFTQSMQRIMGGRELRDFTEN